MPSVGQISRRVGRLPTRSHHNWGSSLTREEREQARREPVTLDELEKLARRAYNRMARHTDNPNFENIMDLLRNQYNLSFKILCKKCHGTHGYDELNAPEREPIDLTDLLTRAETMSKAFAMVSDESEEILFELAVTILRRDNNMLFMLICDCCQGLHERFEDIFAPER